MSPKTADPETREALIEAAARLLAEEGPTALSTRRLATEVGTSTMAVYTHFGGMDELHRAVREEGFARLMSHLRSVPATRDPVADLTALGWAYCFNAVANPHLYRAIFLEAPIDDAEATVGRSTFEQLIATVARCIEAGRFQPADPESLAVQLWTAGHGMICAVLAHVLSIEQVIVHFSAMARNLYVGFGDHPDTALRSIKRARQRMQRTASTSPRARSSHEREPGRHRSQVREGA
jgi:AcrR family transcriptional regulator